MRGVIRIRKQRNAGEIEKVNAYFIDRGGVIGIVEVSKDEYEAAFPDKPIGGFGVQLPWVKPIVSDGLAVTINRIKQAEEFSEKHGVPTDFSSNDGRPVLRDREHRKKLLKVWQMHDNNGGYGDG